MSDVFGSQESRYSLYFLKAYVVNDEHEKNNKKHIKKTDINLLMSPQQIVDYYEGNGNYAYAEDREFVKADELVFFELDCSSHIKIKLEGENAGKVFFGRKMIAENLEIFVRKLDENSGYYF